MYVSKHESTSLTRSVASTANGFVGYSASNFRKNSDPDFMSGQTFFTVFGVFFPTATGVFAGINMSGDLRNPARSIPLGTVSSVGVR